ncbi:MAG: DUF6580 family putative transport protein, partial [Pseudomonadota bacterium]
LDPRGRPLRPLRLAGRSRSHALPHPMGVSTVGAVGMLAAAYLPRKLVIVPVFATILIVDAINGFYSLLAMSFVYIGHLVAALSVSPMLSSIKARSVALAAVISAVVFYLLSNLTPMAMGYYPNTIEGWVTCYVNALPFLLRGILANMIYGGIAFGLIALIGASDARRLFAAQRD